MFVDDSTLVHNKRNFNASEEDIMKVVQQDLKSWSDLLWTTGGLLELTKSKYFMMIWQFDRTGKPSLKPTEDIVPNTVRVKTQSGETAKIKRVSEKEAICMLGVQKAGNLPEEREFKHLLQKTQKFACAILACPVKAHEKSERKPTPNGVSQNRKCRHAINHALRTSLL
eukprot:scaffold172156_cov63-Attheya_sp.AAC.2